MNEENNIVYLKTKSGKILKCYKAESMHKPIYHPVNTKTNGYVDYSDVEKIFDTRYINHQYQILQKENQNLKEIEKEHQKTNGELREKYEKLEEKYLNNVPCCNEEDCGLFREYEEAITKTELASQLLGGYIGVLDDVADTYFKNVLDILQAESED